MFFLPFLNLTIVLVSGSNLANHLVGSLKKGKSATPIPPTTYATLPSNHINREAIVSPSLAVPVVPAHKRSPSSDSGNPGSRSTTPVSYGIGNIPSSLPIFYLYIYLSIYLFNYPLIYLSVYLYQSVFQL